jgi:hypothetical protein
MADHEKEMHDLKDALSRANEEIERLSRITADFISVISFLFTLSWSMRANRMASIVLKGTAFL